MIYLTGIHFFVLSAVIFANISMSSTCNSPRVYLSVIMFLIRLFPLNSARISFSNTFLIYEKLSFFIAKISNALCRPMSRGTKSLLITSVKRRGVKPCIVRKKISARIFEQPQECGARLVTVTNQPVLRPSTISFVFSLFSFFFLFFQLVENIYRL